MSYPDSKSGHCSAASIFISGHTLEFLFMSDRVCLTLFSVPKIKNVILYFRPALEPQILSRQILTGNCCRVVVIMHPGFVQIRIWSSKTCALRVVHGRVVVVVVVVVVAVVVVLVVGVVLVVLTLTL